MLILTRKVGETLMTIVNGEVIAEHTVLGVKGNQVRIGVTADKDVIIHREEVWQEIQKDNNKALAFSDNYRSGPVRSE